MSDVKFIDFAALKDRVSLQMVMQMLDLKLHQSNSQFRGVCPVHGGGDRSFVVTPGKGFYCFNSREGGDQIALCAHVKQIRDREAAELIAKHYGTVQAPPAARKGTSTKASPSTQVMAGLPALTYLEPEHESVQALGISAETAKLFESGYAAKGVLRGRYAVPILQKDGTRVAYVGIAVNDEQSPRLLFHNFDANGFLFNSDAAGAGHLTVCRDPLSLIQAVENGVPREELVSFLAPVTALSLQVLAAFMDENGVETIDLF